MWYCMGQVIRTETKWKLSEPQWNNSKKFDHIETTEPGEAGEPEVNQVKQVNQKWTMVNRTEPYWTR